jgi:hypothetical protein
MNDYAYCKECGCKIPNYQIYCETCQQGSQPDVPKPEMMVCPKPEQMMICPLAKECGDKCRGPAHNKNHEVNTWCRSFTNTGCPACIPVSQSPQQILCKCGHLESEHFEGGGDVTYCEHKDGFYHCVCTRFVPVSPPEPVKPDEGLLLGYYSPEISVLRIRYEQEQKFGLRELLDKSCEAQLAKLQPELDRREARVGELETEVIHLRDRSEAGWNAEKKAKAEAYKEVADKVEGIENPYQEQGTESLNKCIGFGKCREAVKKILGKV